jgi:hypothetical protein
MTEPRKPTRRAKAPPKVKIVIEVNDGGIIEHVYCSAPAVVKKVYTSRDDAVKPYDPWVKSNRYARAYVKRHKLIEVA